MGWRLTSCPYLNLMNSSMAAKWDATTLSSDRMMTSIAVQNSSNIVSLRICDFYIVLISSVNAQLLTLTRVAGSKTSRDWRRRKHRGLGRGWDWWISGACYFYVQQRVYDWLEECRIKQRLLSYKNGRNDGSCLCFPQNIKVVRSSRKSQPLIRWYWLENLR